MDQDRINQFREQQAQQRKEQELIDSIKKSGDNVASAVKQTAQQTQKVQVTNDVATRQDVDSLIKQLKEVQLAAFLSGNKPSVVLADSTDLGETVSALGDKIMGVVAELKKDKSAEQLGAKLQSMFNNFIESLSQMQVASDDSLQQVAEQIYEKLDQLELNPQITVPTPEVTVRPADVDISAITRKLDAVSKELSGAIGKIKMPAFSTLDLQKSVIAVENAINNLRFPVPNYILPFKDPTTGKATQVTLNSNGAMPVAGQLVNEYYDYIDVQQTSSNVDTYVYKSGGSGGTTVATVTVTYTDSTKANIDSIART